MHLLLSFSLLIYFRASPGICLGLFPNVPNNRNLKLTMNYSKLFPHFVSRLIFPTLLAPAFLLLAFNADMLYLSRWQKQARYVISDGIHARFRRNFSEGVQVKYTKEWLQKQFTNPQGIASILLLIGGDIIQKAIAQLACYAPRSVPYSTPVIFSYGWVSYTFKSVANASSSADYFP